MLKRDKNRLLEVIKASSFNVRDFHFDETVDQNNALMFVITYDYSPFRFTVSASSSSYYDFDYRHTLMAPGYPLSAFSLKSDAWHNIDAICEVLEDWLQHELKDYVDDLTAPDLWTELATGPSLVSDSQLEENGISEFSAEEKKQIQVSIDRFRSRLIDEFEVTQEHLKIIDKRLQYLVNALDRLNRFDWRAVLISTVFSISTALSLDTERGKVLWDIAKEIFSQAIRLLVY